MRWPLRCPARGGEQCFRRGSLRRLRSPSAAAVGVAATPAAAGSCSCRQITPSRCERLRGQGPSPVGATIRWSAAASRCLRGTSWRPACCGWRRGGPCSRMSRSATGARSPPHLMRRSPRLRARSRAGRTLSDDRSFTSGESACATRAASAVAVRAASTLGAGFHSAFAFAAPTAGRARVRGPGAVRPSRAGRVARWLTSRQGARSCRRMRDSRSR